MHSDRKCIEWAHFGPPQARKIWGFMHLRSYPIPPGGVGGGQGFEVFSDSEYPNLEPGSPVSLSGISSDPVRCHIELKIKTHAEGASEENSGFEHQEALF